METETNPMHDNVTQVADYIINFIDKGNVIDNWVLTRTPYPSLIILFAYFLFVLKIGPQFMKNRSPFDLNIVMRVYNVCQVLGNVRLIYYPFVEHIKYLPYSIRLSCNVPKETDENIDVLLLSFLHLLHGYFVLKIMDLLDTVFMVLRKKNSHITFLHVYHHGIMVFGTWYTIKYLKPVQAVLPGMINVIVHIVMYSYFFLATFGEPVKKYLWWKKYLTKLQLTQFVVIIIYLVCLYYNGCPMSKAFTYFWLFNAFAFLCLFLNFYVRAYVLKPNNLESEKTLEKKN